jgi:hypothetical protein
MPQGSDWAASAPVLRGGRAPRDRSETVSGRATIDVVLHAGRSADIRRRAMKPTPAKPKISVAQVQGSGTAAVTATMPRKFGLAEVENRFVSRWTSSIAKENVPP